jgi:glycosyltransferase involved in cell wall biosynthesis
MKRVCIVFHNSDRFNGATRSMLDLIEQWNKMPELQILAITPRKGTVNEVLDNWEIENYIYNYHGVRYFAEKGTKFATLKNIFYHLRMIYEKIITVPKAASFINKEKVDIIYSNTGAVYFGFWLSQITRIKHVWHIREMGQEDQNARFYFGFKYFLRLLNRSDLIITISNTVYNKYSKFIKNKTKIVMRYNDLSPDNIHYQIREKKEPFNLLLVGSIIEGKGHEHVIKTIKRLRDNKYNVELYVAGKNSSRYYEKIKELTKQLNIESFVHFLGHIKDMVALKREMQAEIVSSKCEAFGRITVEAMLCNLPIVGADTGCTIELIGQNVNGILYHWGDEVSLYESVKSVYDNYSDALDRANNAYKFGLSFTEGKTAQAIKTDLLQL